VDGKRVAALEVMMDTPRIRDLIQKGEVAHVKEAMEQGVQEGCQTFDHVLFVLYRQGKISLEQALINADSANNLRLKIKLAELKGEELPANEGEDGEDEQAGFKIKGLPPGAVRRK
jgi:twitching motility protein PilU